MAQRYPKDKLNIWVLNDRSADDTGQIARRVSAVYPLVKVFDIPPGENQGKARVLNYGLSMVSTPFLSIYDADNRPEPEASCGSQWRPTPGPGSKSRRSSRPG